MHGAVLTKVKFYVHEQKIIQPTRVTEKYAVFRYGSSARQEPPGTDDVSDFL